MALANTSAGPPLEHLGLQLTAEVLRHGRTVSAHGPRCVSRAHRVGHHDGGYSRRVQQCDDCLGLKVTSVFAGFGSFCAPCASKRACRPGGLPPPPDPPPPVTITGPDGTARQLAFRVWRCHNGVVVDLREVGVQGFSFSTISALGRHDQPIDAQVQHLIVEAREAIGTVHLDRPRPGAPLMLTGNEVTGELVWPDHSYPYGRYPYDVVVDGKQMSWQEFGLMLEPFEGFRFHLLVQENCTVVHEDDTTEPGQ